MKTDFLNLIPCSLTIIYAIHGSWFLITEIFYSIVPFTVLFTVIIVGLIQFFRIPPPDVTAVEAIIGKEPHIEAENEFPIKTIAHRGAGLDVPENSLVAFKWCLEKGCNVIEFDIRLTSDGIPIVFHDATLERMADVNLVINETKWDQIKDVDISVKHHLRDKFGVTKIPTLDQAIEQMLSHGQIMFIDVKDNSNKIVSIIHDLYDKHSELYSRAIVTSFFPNIIYLIRKGNPKIVCSLAWRPYVFTNEYFKYPEGKGPRKANVWYKHAYYKVLNEIQTWALPRITYYMLGLSVVLLHKDGISGEVILNWRSKGVRVIAWSVNSPIEKQHFTRNLKITYLTDTLTGENTVHSCNG